MPIDIKTKFVSFDMNGTLIDFKVGAVTREVLGDRLPAEIADSFARAYHQFRIDECMGEWKPFVEIVDQGLRRTMQMFGLEYHEGDGQAVFDQIPSWGPHAGVPAALKRLAEAYPLVIVTNSDDAWAPRLVKALEAPFDVVITAEQMGVYKPRLRAFQYMLDKLGVAPDEIVHVSSSAQYDLRPAADVGIKHRVFMDRGLEPAQPWIGYERITDIADLPAVLGLSRP